VKDGLIRNVDCVSLPVPDLDTALAFYRDGLGHQLIWRTQDGIGLRLPDSEADLVLRLEERPQEVNLKVDSVPETINRFCESGGSLVEGPFDIAIGKCAVVADPYGNTLILLDTSKGLFETDGEGNVIGLRQAESHD
jgi:predicted enzyme related to lactoylglutathione lyase